jgi:hypothetical protein
MQIWWVETGMPNFTVKKIKNISAAFYFWHVTKTAVSLTSGLEQVEDSFLQAKIDSARFCGSIF